MSPRRRSQTPSRAPLVAGALALAVLAIFAGGQLWVWFASDAGRLFLAKRTGLGDRAHATRLVGKRVREGLARAGIPADSVHESVLDSGTGARLRWRVALPEDRSPMQANFAVTRAVEESGAEILSGRERVLDGGGIEVTLVVGLGGRPTHELRIARAGQSSAGPGDAGVEPPARLALVLYGWGDDVAATRRLMSRAEPFAVAAPAADAAGDALRAAARETHREVVLQVPLEPENYPRVNPGPATLLVSMPPRRIAGLTRRYIEDARPIVAVSNLMGSFATQDEPLVTAMYSELRRAAVPFLHVSPAPRAVCRTLASRLGVAYDEPDEILDVTDYRRGEAHPALDRAWKRVRGRAAEQGSAIVLLRVDGTSGAWLDGALSAKRLPGITLVALSRVIRRPATE